MPSPTPLIGRDAELQRLVDAFWDVHRSRQGRCVVVHGPAGMGASRLVAELPAELRRRRLLHEWWGGACSRTASVPYEPMVGLLRDVPGGAGQWIAEATDAARAAVETTGAALLAGLARRLDEAADSATIVLVVDDLDGADPSTIRLLGALVPLLRDMAVLVIVTAREADGQPLVMGDVAADRLALGPLGAETSRMLLSVLSEGLDDADLSTAMRAGQGRPSVLVAWAAAGSHVGGLASLLRGLGSGAADVVAVVAMADGSFTADDVTVVAGCADDVVERLVRVGALTRSPAQHLRPQSEVWVDAARQIVGERWPQLSSLTADRLPAGADRRLVAHLLEQAGRRTPAAELWEQAARAAMDGHATATAAADLRRAIALGGRATLQRCGRLAAEWSLAAGDRADAERLASELLPWVPRADTDTMAALLVLKHRALFEMGSPEADATLDAALAVGGPGRAQVDAVVLDVYRLVAHDIAAAQPRADDAVALASRSGDPSSLAAALGAKALVQAFAGDIEPSLTTFDEAIGLAVRAGTAADEARLASNRVYVLWRAGRPVDVEREAGTELQRLRARGSEVLGDQLALLQAVALAQLGRLDAAYEALAFTRQVNVAADTRALVDLLDAELDIVGGRLARARSTIERLPTDSTTGVAAVAGELALRKHELALADGRWADAASIASRGGAQAGGADTVALARLLLAERRALSRLGQPVTGAVAVGADGGELGGGAGREVAAIGAELVAIASDHDRDWSAALDAWTSLPAPFEAWRCALGRAARRQDLTALEALIGAARELGAEGLAVQAELAWRTGGGRRPSRRTEGSLTEREVEVLGFVALGLTNKEIAARLRLSPRTVGVHVEHCCGKLDVSTRGAAVHAATRLGVL